MKFNPLKSSETIVQDYRRYILTTFKTNNTSINEQLSNLVSDKEISKGPYLSISKNYERTVKMIDLIPSVLSKGFLRLNGKLRADKITLFRHQVSSIDTVINNDHNLILSTGTGSGKTLSFLIPIINYLLEEEEKGTLTPGVRAMLIYPMNALANDQMDTLRGYLKGTKITFGSYTGETEESFDRNIVKKYIEKNGHEPTNEMLFREDMRKNPPNILITNYTMLEHLLIKPENKSLFGTPGENHWKYIVLDEAHMYTGARGSEVSILLRRLTETLKRKEIRFILTSATLGDENDNQNVVNFANDLCGLKVNIFELPDVIRASYYEILPPNEFKKIDNSFYTNLAEIIDHNTDGNMIEYEIDDFLDEHYENTEGSDYKERLYNIVSYDERLYELQKILSEGPLAINDVIDQMNSKPEFVIPFIQICSLASKDGYKLFDSRYHMFIRSIDGVFTTLTDNPHVFIHPMSEYDNPQTGQKEQVFQIATCNNCGCIYLVGKIFKGHFTQSTINEEFIKDSAYMLIDQDAFIEDEYTDKELEENVFKICTVCGSCTNYCYDLGCHHDPGFIKYLYCKNEGNTKVATCNNCGQRENIRGMLRQLYLGHDSSTAVISSSLFDELDHNTDHRFISFSDNRQNAAYFAPYLQDTHENMVLHRAMWETISKNKEKLSDKGMDIESFKQELECCINKRCISTSIFKEGKNGNEQGSQDAWMMLMIDCAKYNSNKSFEYIGQVYYTVDHLIKKKDYDTFGLSEKDARELANQIGKFIRDAVHIEIPDEIFCDEYLSKYYGDRRPDRIALDKNNAASKTPYLLTNAVKRYLANTIGEDNIKKICYKVLSGCCNSKDGTYAIDMKKMIVKRKDHTFLCTKCNKTTPFNVKNICPKCGNPTLVKIETSSLNQENSYAHNFSKSTMRSLRIKEHTAQLSPEQARDYQDKFKDGQFDALSCSTTFEVGVDIGDLNVVLMRNMPPTPANYIQRAGRAGRSPDSSAYSITFCKNSSHDTTFFKNPLDMINGKVPVPNIKPENPRIVIRHIFASALSYYWKNVYGRYPKNICDFMDDLNNLEKYLGGKPNDLKEYLHNVVPDQIIDLIPNANDKNGVRIGIDSFAWVDELMSDDYGRLRIAADQYHQELESLEEYEKIRGKSNQYARNRITNEPTLDFLSRHNIIPKYGFPVDLVSLEKRNESTNNNLRLQRDLSRAISEYAPGSEVVADGKVLTSSYIKKLTNKSWPRYYYKKCSKCNTINIVEDLGQDIKTASDELHTCTSCNSEMSSLVDKFIIPRYGFLYNSNEIKDLAGTKPTHSYAGEVFYRGNNNIVMEKIDLHGHSISYAYGMNDELVIINKSKFYVCNYCGYSSLEDWSGKKEHETPSGRKCKCESNEGPTSYETHIGHIFHTDVFMMSFDQCPIHDYDTAISIMSALVTSFSKLFYVDENEISGCIYQASGEYRFILYDNTPGGAGYVKHILKDNMENVYRLIMKSLEIAKNCDCGGEDNLDCACYSCLLNYHNQRYHERIKRSLVIDKLKIFEE